MPAAGARLLLPALSLLALGLVAACQDPSGVGLGLIGEEGNDPNVVVVPADSLSLTEEPELTGGFASGSSALQERVLVGAVTDPTFGDASAEAYFDVSPPGTVPNGFFDRTITSATLRLARDYAYGDTTATLDLALYDVAESWNPVGARADTAFAVGSRVDTYDVSAADTLSSLALPTSWVAANDQALRSDSVLTRFNGFKLQLAEGAMGGAVVGFDATRSRLRLTTSQDTVDYVLREVFTHVERGEAAPAADDVVLVRDGVAEALALTLPFEEVSAAAVARATFRLSADPSLLDAGMLTRALPRQLALVGVTESESKLFLASATLSEETSTYTFTSNTLTNVVQDAVLGTTLFTRYLVVPAQNPLTLDVLPAVTGPVPGVGDPEGRPRLVLTIVPTAD